MRKRTLPLRSTLFRASSPRTIRHLRLENLESRFVLTGPATQDDFAFVEQNLSTAMDDHVVEIHVLDNDVADPSSDHSALHVTEITYVDGASISHTVDLTSVVGSASYGLPKGTLTVNADHTSFEFMPTDDEGTGNASFQYKATDDAGTSANEDVHIRIVSGFTHFNTTPPTGFFEGDTLQLVAPAAFPTSQFSFQWYVDASPVNPIGVTGDVDWSALNAIGIVDGLTTRDIIVVATDNNTNAESFGSASLSVINTPPNPEAYERHDASGCGSTTSVTMTWTLRDANPLDTSFTAQVDGLPGTPDTSVTPNGDGSYAVTVTADLEEGDYFPILTVITNGINGIDFGTETAFWIVDLLNPETTGILHVDPPQGGGGDLTADITYDPDPADEGSEVHLHADLTGGCGDPPVLTWIVTKGIEEFNGTGEDFSFTPTDSGEYSVTLLADGDPLEDGTVEVSNVAPSASVAGDSTGVPFQSLSFSLSASDPSSVDQAANFTYTVDWGDGTQTLSAASPANTTHAYTAPGSYEVTVTAEDKDGGPSLVSAPHNVVVTQYLVTPGGVLNVGGTSADDTFLFKQAATAGLYKALLNGNLLGNTFAPTTVQFFGGSGTDTLNVDGDGTANAFEVRSDRIVFNGIGIFDDAIESRVVNAHGSTDTITVYGGSATVNGGSGSDALIAASGVNTWTLTLPTAGTLNGITFTSIQQLVGAGSDTLVGPNTSNVWKVAGIGSGTLGGGAFSGFAALQGGTANDTFRITEGIASGLSLDGGAGTDKLDYAAYAGAIDVDLAAATATGSAHVAGIENVQGGDGADIIRGDGNDNILAGGAGTDILIGGAGNDTLSGGAASDILIGGTGADLLAGNADEDILIGGTTIYDANDAALAALLATWSGTGTYSARVTSVNTGSGVAGGYYLLGDDGVTQTVFTDNDVDTLTGSGGKDFFFANKTADNGGPIDIVTDQSASEFWVDTDF
jgi:hypothetical protein